MERPPILPSDGGGSGGSPAAAVAPVAVANISAVATFEGANATATFGSPTDDCDSNLGDGLKRLSGLLLMEGGAGLMGDGTELYNESVGTGYPPAQLIGGGTGLIMTGLGAGMVAGGGYLAARPRSCYKDESWPTQ